MTNGLSDDELRQIFHALPPSPNIQPGFVDRAARRACRATSRRHVVVGMAAVTACVCAAGGAIALERHTGSQSTGPTVSSVSPLPTCGVALASNGPLAQRLHLALEGPAEGPSGGQYAAHLVVSSTSGAVKVMTSNNIDLLIVKDGAIVGRSGRPVAGTGLAYTLDPRAPQTFPVSVTLSGCPSQISSPAGGDIDTTRKPLPAGDYVLIARMDDDTNGEQNAANLVSQPLVVHVVAGGQTSADPAPSAETSSHR